MQHEFHEFAAMFPLMEGEDFEQLVADIKAHGQRETIVMLDNKVLDGRNRYNACMKLGIKPRLRDFNCIDGDPLDFVWSANVTRRHLNESQRAIAMVKRSTFMDRSVSSRIGGLIRQGKTEEAAAVGMQAEGYTSEEAAKIARVSARQIGRAKSILKYGTPEEIAAIERGEKRIYQVSEAAVKRAPIEIKPRTGAGGYTRMNIPDNYTPEQYTRKGLEYEKEGMDPSYVHTKLGIADNSYMKMREIVLINDRTDLSARDREAAQNALETLNKTRQIATCVPMVEHLVKRIWGEGRSKTEKVAEDRVNEFEKRIEILFHACEIEVDIPQISSEQVHYATDRLEDSIRSLRRLINRLKEVHSD